MNSPSLEVHIYLPNSNNLLCAGSVSVCTVSHSRSSCIVVSVAVWSSLPPGLAAQHAHTGDVDAYEPPSHQVFEGRQSAYKSVRVGAVGVPVPRIDPQAAGAARVRAVTRGLKEVLLLVHVVDVHVWQHRDLVARYVHGFGLVAHPDADALAHRVNSTVLRQLSSPSLPFSGAM